MPFHFEEKDMGPEIDGLESVLIVPCRFCPAASAAVRNDEPYIDLPRHFLKTESYERLIDTVRSDIEDRGIRADVFKSYLVHQFVLCMWTSSRRMQLAERAKDYDAIVVLGCEAAVDTVRDAVDSSGCRVIQGMNTEGLMSIQPHFGFLGTVRLELQGISPTTFPKQRA